MSRFYTFLFLASALLPLGAWAFRPVGHRTVIQTETTVAGLLYTDALEQDSTPPTISCPPSDTVTLGPGRCDTVYWYTVTAHDSLMDIKPIQVIGLPSGAAFPLGATLNAFIATDTAGNTATCSFNVLVKPYTGVLFCQDKTTVELGTGCAAVVKAEDVLETPYGCPKTFTLEIDKTAPFGNGPWLPANLGPNDLKKTYQIRVTDPASNNKCFGNISAVDSLPPSLVCPEMHIPCALPIAHLAPIFLKDSLGLTDGMPVLKDNCTGNPSLNFVDVVSDLPCDTPGNVTGRIRRFWTAVDGSGNVATCVQTINRTRDLKDVRFPDDITIACDGGNTLPENTGGPYVQVGNRTYSLLNTPLCETTSNYTDSVEALCGGSRRLYRAWKVRDACRPDSVVAPVAGVQRIDVQDQQGPQLFCPGDTVVQVHAVNCQDTTHIPGVIVRDGCSSVAQVIAYWAFNGVTDSLTAVLTDFPGNQPADSDTLAVFGDVPNFPAGITHILYVATDACGNTASCVTELYVWDGTPPKAVCDTLLKTYLNVEGKSVLTAEMADNGSSDDCGDMSFKIRRIQASPCDSMSAAFTDQLHFCCSDGSDTIPAVLRVFDIDLPAGPVSSTFAQGQYSDCALKILVLDTNPPSCKAPANVTVTCENFDPTLAAFGDVNGSCKVDSSMVQISYAAFDTACTRGTISRTFRVFDKTGDSGLCTQYITVTNEQRYFIHFPDDQIVYVCDTTGIYGEPQLGDVACESMEVTFTDEVFSVVPDACFKIERTWRVVNRCTYNPVLLLTLIPNPNPSALNNHPDNLPGPVVSPPDAPAPWVPTAVKINPTDPAPTNFSIFWTANANGYTYKQIIKVIDTDAPVIENCPDAPLEFADTSANDLVLWKANYTTDPGTPDADLCETTTDLHITATDACYGANVDITYHLYLDLNDDGDQETVIDSDNPPAAGTVDFNNILSSGESRPFDNGTDKYRFTIQSVSIGRHKTAAVAWQKSSDPMAYFLPQLPLGTHRIKWMVSDGCGGLSECEYTFTISGNCAPTQLTVNGTIRTEANAGVANVAAALDGAHPSLPTFNLFDLTDAQGYYEFSVPTGATYMITPVRDDNPLNGVSTFDLLQINKHVLGLSTLPSPYKIIAADANNSRSVTTFDIVEFRKLILGIYAELPNNTSWRFVPKDFVFPNPGNPFQTLFPETVTVNNVQATDATSHDFVGIKVGDMNGNASPSLVSETPGDRAVLTLLADDQRLQPGQVVQIPIRATETLALAGLQFAWQFDPAALEVLQVTLAVGQLREETFFALPQPGLLTFSWDDPSAPQVKAGDPVLYLSVRARTAISLRSAFQPDTRQLRPEAYTGNDDILTLRLDVENGHPIPGKVEIYPAQPNPSRGRVQIPVSLPEPAAVVLEVYDPAGKQLYRSEQHLPQGWHPLEMPADALGHMPGILLYRVQAGDETASGKLVRF